MTRKERKIILCSENELEFVSAGFFDHHVHYHEGISSYRNSRPATNIETIVIGVATIIIGAIIVAVGSNGARKKELFAVTD